MSPADVPVTTQNNKVSEVSELIANSVEAHARTVLTYSGEDFDHNGALYHIATQGGRSEWSNPHDEELIEGSMLSEIARYYRGGLCHDDVYDVSHVFEIDDNYETRTDEGDGPGWYEPWSVCRSVYVYVCVCAKMCVCAYVLLVNTSAYRSRCMCIFYVCVLVLVVYVCACASACASACACV